MAVDRPSQARPPIQQPSVKLVRLFQVVLNNEAICLMAKRQPFVCETKKFRLLSLGCVARHPDALLGAVDEIADGLAHVTQCPRASASSQSGFHTCQCRSRASEAPTAAGAGAICCTPIAFRALVDRLEPRGLKRDAA